MSNRNPSRCSKSEKERQYLQHELKKVSSSDTAPIDSPFEPSNALSKEAAPKKSAKRRPQPVGRRIAGHFKKHSAKYVTCFIGLVATLYICPLFTMNREIGEVKSEIMHIKEQSINNDRFKGQNISEISSRLMEEITSIKQQLDKMSYFIFELSSKTSSIRTYLLNKFGAKI
ncbi:MAG: hypothetical protein WC779_05345 [Candidatus Omnitrophota bacterium]|jgi:hypothetical protein